MKNIITITAIATIGTLGLAACGDVSNDELREALIEQGASEDEAACVVDYLEENLSEDEFQAAAKADEIDEISEETSGVITDAIIECNAF